MNTLRGFRSTIAAHAGCGVLLLSLAGTIHAVAQTSPLVLDRVVAVVNNQAILESDLLKEKRLSILEPNVAGQTAESPQLALQRLISRTLIRQQIREEDAQTAVPTADEVAARLSGLRKELPVCVRENCATDAGWNAFLQVHDLTQLEVEAYLRSRLEILHFIEIRFRQGIRIEQQQIATYYHDTLLPQYQSGQTVPTLEQVAPRIEEILLQQQVNTLFSGWLDNLRKQGDVEVLDSTLEAAASPNQGAGAQ